LINLIHPRIFTRHKISVRNDPEFNKSFCHIVLAQKATACWPRSNSGLYLCISQILMEEHSARRRSVQKSKWDRRNAVNLQQTRTWKTAKVR